MLNHKQHPGTAKQLLYRRPHQQVKGSTLVSFYFCRPFTLRHMQGFPLTHLWLQHQDQMESSEIAGVPQASPSSEEAVHPANRAKDEEEEGKRVRTVKKVLHVRRKVLSSPAQGKKRRRKSSSGEEEDAMYFSPLDSSSEVFFVGLLVISLVSIGTRLYKIDEPQHVA